MEIPTVIYKYMSIDEKGYCFENLKQYQLYFNKPVNFNDPYDSDIPVLEKSLTKLSLLKDKQQNPVLDELTLNEYKRVILTDIKPSFEKTIKDLINLNGVTCFSERKSNILMWSHYADSHKGMCLEFRTDHSYFEKLIKVKYDNFLPELDLLKYWNNKLTEVDIMQYFCTKFKDWEYEKEHRLIMSQGDKAYHYPKECLTGIYLGLKTKPEVIKSLKSICPNVPIHQARKSETEFKVEFDLI